MPPPSNELGAIIDYPHLQAACASCNHREPCLPCGLPESALRALDGIMTQQLLEAREYLFHPGAPFHSLYVVRSGTIKTVIINEQGMEQVIGFHLPGEIIGLDAIARERHSCFAQTLETTNVCAIPFTLFEELARRIPELAHHLLCLMSSEILEDKELIMMVGAGSAEQRFASFLLSLSSRFRKLGFSAREFNLSMSRKDIANYLGLALETVSRIFSRFHQQGLITVDGKKVWIDDIESLRAISFRGHHSD